MQNTKLPSRINRDLILAWSTLCIFVFIVFPGRASFIYWSNLVDLPFLLKKFQRIDLIFYSINLLGAFVGVVLFSIAYVSLGLFVIKSLNGKIFERLPSDLARSAYLGTGFLVGHGIFSLLFITLAGLYRITSTEVIISLSLGFLLGLRQLKAPGVWIHSKIKAWKMDFAAPSRDGILIGLVCCALFFSLFLSAARISYDSTAIYFSDAKITALTGQLRFFTNDTFVASVFQTAIQFTALIQVFGDQAARLFSWVCGIVVIIFSLALAEELGLSKQARVLLAAMLVSSTAFLDLFGDGKVDLISFAPAISALYWMVVQYRSQRQDKFYFLLIGFLSGLSIVARLFNAFLLAVFIFLFYSQTAVFQKDSTATLANKLSKFLQILGWISAGAIGLGIFHLFVNWMIFQNPFAFISNIANINPATGPWDYNPKQLLATRLLYPFVVSFKNTPQSLGNISPLFVVSLPIFFLKDIRNSVKLQAITKIVLFAAAVSLILWIFVFFTITEIRYVFFLWIILYYPASEFLAAFLNSHDRYFNYLQFGLIALLLVFINFRAAFISIDAYSPVDSRGNPHCYDRIFCEYLAPINQNAGQGDRVLTLGAYRYYLRTDLFSCSTTDQEYGVLRDLSYRKDSGAFWTEVYRRGFKYIAYENDYTIRHLRFGMIPGPQNMPDWIQLQPLYGNDRNVVIAYRISAINPPIKEERTCQQNANGVWTATDLP